MHCRSSNYKILRVTLRQHRCRASHEVFCLWLVVKKACYDYEFTSKSGQAVA
jgi:hypothetical protein